MIDDAGDIEDGGKQPDDAERTEKRSYQGAKQVGKAPTICSQNGGQDWRLIPRQYVHAVIAIQQASSGCVRTSPLKQNVHHHHISGPRAGSIC